MGRAPRYVLDQTVTHRSLVDLEFIICDPTKTNPGLTDRVPSIVLLLVVNLQPPYSRQDFRTSIRILS
jgi:hypothetical protein